MINNDNHATHSRRNSSAQTQYVTSNQSCGSAFNCGAEYATLQARVEQLSQQVEQLEYEVNQSSKYVQAATSLIKLQRFILILLSILELAAVCLILYLYANINAVGYTVVGLIGLTTIINGLYLPKQVKDIEVRVSKIESNR